MAKKRKTEERSDQDVPPVRRCGAMEVHERMLRTVRGYAEARVEIENRARRATLSPFLERSGCTTIPVVVHVVYNTPGENISDEQVESQIEVLNEDFRRTNADIGTVPSAFSPLTGDARISFELASVDPDGNATNGITRTQSDEASFSSADDGIKFASSGGADAWPRDDYLNIWVGPRIVNSLGNSLLGYAQFPGGPADTDGVVILHSAFGTTGTAAAPFDRGRTTTHEVGHWLNLRHIWGDDGTGCHGSDFVDDTPNQGGPNYGTPTFPTISCDNGPNGDMFMNYMDYVDDAAMVMFSQGQVTRMQATLDGARSSIGTTSPCGKALPKDVPKEFPKDPPKEFPKDPPKEFPKDPPKEFPKDPPKEFPKDPPKDWPKDPPKEFPKDPPKDWPKDPPKDWPKDPPKDFDPGPKFFDPGPKLSDPGPKGFDPGPKLSDPGPKLSDPGPKLLDPGPKGFDPGPKLSDPGPFPHGGGGVPFVMATTASGGWVSQPASGYDQRNAALAASYLQYMSYYARLHAAGMLDAAGLQAWHQTAEAYRRLVGGGA